MSKRKALAILIRHAAENCRSAGTGIRAVASVAEKREVILAIEELWSDAYSFTLDDQDWRNMGLDRTEVIEL